MKFKLTLLLLGILSLSAASAQAAKCDLNFKKSKLCGQIKWVVLPKNVEMPTAKDRAEFLLTLSPGQNKKAAANTSADKSSTLPDEVIVKPFMPAMGHGSQPTVVTVEVDATGKAIPRIYRVKDVYFTMGGEWELRVELRK
jgi:hypothetical protein